MKAIERASMYLNIKPRTEFQVEKYLKDKGYENEEISQAIEQLKEYNYIDDAAYASMYFELGFEKGRGMGRIRRELAGKGVSDDIIQEALESLDEIPDQYSMALEAGRDIVKSAAGAYDSTTEMLEDMSYEDRQKLQAKVARRLAARGFSGDIVYKVAREVTM